MPAQRRLLTLLLIVLLKGGADTIKIGDWTVQVKGKDPQVFVYKNKVQKRTIPLDKFEQRGMILFPKPLYRLITGSLKHSNTYDRFIDKFYDFIDQLQ